MLSSRFDDPTQLQKGRRLAALLHAFMPGHSPAGRRNPVRRRLDDRGVCDQYVMMRDHGIHAAERIGRTMCTSSGVMSHVIPLCNIHRASSAVLM